MRWNADEKPSFHALAGFMVRTASLLVPRRDRSAWKAEWTAELWHLCHPRCCDPGDAPDADPLEFSFGAFHDAFWLRCDRIRSSGLARLAIGIGGALRTRPCRDRRGRAVRAVFACPALAPRCYLSPGAAPAIWS